MMFIYNYEPLTGAYTGRSDADPDPMTPDGYLIPAHATKIAPPVVVSGEVAVFSNGAWAVVQDNRGVWYTANGGEVIVTAPGDAAPANAVRTAPPSALHVLQAGAWMLDIARVAAAKTAEIEAARDAACYADVGAMGCVWQADKRSQELLGQAITLAQAGLPLPPVWRDKDNVDLTIATLADLLAIAGAMAAQTQAAYSRSWSRKAEISGAVAANDLAALQAVVW